MHSVLLDAIESIHGLSHQGGVRDDLLHVASPLVVQDGSLLFTWNLDTLESLLVTAREGHLVTVHDNIFVTLQEIHLEASGIDHGWAKVDIGWVQASIDCVVVS